jgi:hypothetical protein
VHPFLRSVPYSFHQNTTSSSRKDMSHTWHSITHSAAPPYQPACAKAPAHSIKGNNRSHASDTTQPAHDAQIQTVLQNSRARRTVANHESAVRAFCNFCENYGYRARPASEYTLCAYVAHLASSMASSSIANALSGVRAGTKTSTHCGTAARGYNKW